jgi:hypothetical protein
MIRDNDPVLQMFRVVRKAHSCYTCRTGSGSFHDISPPCWATLLVWQGREMIKEAYDRGRNEIIEAAGLCGANQSDTDERCILHLNHVSQHVFPSDKGKIFPS